MFIFWILYHSSILRNIVAGVDDEEVEGIVIVEKGRKVKKVRKVRKARKVRKVAENENVVKMVIGEYHFPGFPHTILERSCMAGNHHFLNYLLALTIIIR